MSSAYEEVVEVVDIALTLYWFDEVEVEVVIDDEVVVDER